MGSELSAHQKLLLEMLKDFDAVCRTWYSVSAVCRERVGRGQAQRLYSLG